MSRTVVGSGTGTLAGTDGQRVVGGRYRLMSQLDAGRHGERWEATDTVLARPVIVELASPAAKPRSKAASARPDLERTAFERAISTSARLAHPGIVAVYDTGWEDGRAYVVTERPPGLSLRATLRHTGRLPAERVTRIGCSLAGALAAAHRLRVMHGTLCLDDVVVDDDDHVKVGGWGAPGVTEIGGGVDADVGVDIAAAGALLYELLCNHPVPGDPRPSRDHAGVPPALDHAIASAIDGRIVTAATLHDSLAIVDTTPDDAVPDVVREPTPPLGMFGGESTASSTSTSRSTSRSMPPSAAPSTSTSASTSAPPNTSAGVIALTVVAVALAAVAGVLFLHLRPQTSSRARNKPGPARALLAITDVKAFDPPPGDGIEGDVNLPLVHDGNPATKWSTEFYRTRDFGGLRGKTGVGLYLVLDRSHSVHNLTVTSPVSGWSAQVYTAPQPATALGGWGKPVAQFTVEGNVTTVPISSAQGQYVLVWITDLGPARTGAIFRVDIGELGVT